MDTKTLLLIGAAFVGYKLLTKKKADKESSIWDALVKKDYSQWAEEHPDIDPSQFYERPLPTIDPDIFNVYV